MMLVTAGSYGAGNDSLITADLGNGGVTDVFSYATYGISVKDFPRVRGLANARVNRGKRAPGNAYIG